MVEASEEGKQVEQEYGYHSYIQPGEYIAKLEGRTWYGKHNCMGLCCYFHTKEGEQLALYAFRTRWAPYIYTTKKRKYDFHPSGEIKDGSWWRCTVGICKSSGRSTWIKAEPIEEKELEELEVLSSKERNNKKESE